MLIRRARRRLQLEDVPMDGAASYALRAYQWSNFRFNWHQHPEIEIGYIVRGHGRRYVGDAVEDYAEGDFCLLGPDLPHTWHSEPERGISVRSLCLQFLPERLGKDLWQMTEMRGIERLLARSARGLKAVGKTGKLAGERLTALYETPRGGWRDVAGLLDLLGLLADSDELLTITSPAYQPAPGGVADKRVNALFALLHRAPEDIPTQAEAARALGFSGAPGFSRFVRRTVGRTWAACVGERRLANACRALIETDERITAVAFAAGFANLSNFNRRFRAALGVTPQEYRGRARRAERTG